MGARRKADLAGILARMARWGGVALLLLGLVAALLPALAATPMVGWWAGRASARSCGTFSVGEVELGWTTAFRYLGGQPLHVGARRVEVLGPDGQRVLWAERIQAELRLERWPFRVTSVSADVTGGGWRLAALGDTTGLAAAFRSRSSRNGCQSGPAPPGLPATASRQVTFSFHLRDVDTSIDFPAWGLDLASGNAAGGLTLGAASTSFDIRDISTGHASLRVGRAGSAVTVPFDSVAGARVTAAAAAAGDLALEVGAARTGRAELSGRATFAHVLGGGHRSPPGLDLDGRWVRLADALAASEVPWLPRGSWRERLAGDARFVVRGPFSALTSTVGMHAEGIEARGTMSGDRAALSATLTDVETADLVGPRLPALLAGRLSGKVDASLRIGRSGGATTAEIPRARLRLERAVTDRHGGPRRIELTVGPTGAPASSTKIFSASVTSVRLERRRLHGDGVRLRWRGLGVHARATLTLPRDDAPPRLTASGTVDIPAVGPVAGTLGSSCVRAALPLRLAVSARGSVDRLALRARVRPRTLAVCGARYRLPPRIAATWAVDRGTQHLTIAPVTMVGEHGGRVTWTGWLDAGAFAAKLAIRNQPLAGLPGAHRWPALRRLHGRVDADIGLTIDGRPLAVRGTAELTQALALAVPGWRAPLTVAAGGRLDFAGDELSTPGLALRAPGLDAVVRGCARIDGTTLARTTLNGSLSAAIAAGQLPFDVPGTTAVAGNLLVEAKLAGPLAPLPSVDGHVRVDDLTIVPVSRSGAGVPPELRARGELELHGATLSSRDLRVDMARVGTVHVGAASAPAEVEVLSLRPLRLGRVDVPLSGEHLALSGGGLRVADLSAQTRLVRDAAGGLRLRGRIELGGASYEVGRSPANDDSAPWFKRLPPWLTLDLELRADDAVSIGLPVLPDLSLGMRCRVVANRDGVRTWGRITGRTTYARTALRLYDWVGRRNLGRCQIASQ